MGMTIDDVIPILHDMYNYYNDTDIDAYVGLPSILYDTDAERRKLYGKAGCFRLQPYG